MLETPPQRGLGRSIAAVLAGFAVLAVVSTAVDQVLHATGVYPPAGQPMATGLWVLATAYRLVISVFGCYLAARLAPNRPMGHALALGLLGVLISLAGAIYAWDKGPGFGPKWYPIGLVVTALPTAWLGGWLYLRRPSKR
jgi:hypothetical protein